MTIDIDEEKAQRPITRREKIAVFILLTLFKMMMPATYSHQTDKFVEKIDELMK